MKNTLSNFNIERERLQELMQNNSGIHTKRFLNLDSNVYKKGALSTPIKELLGLVSSLVLRCDDCITYHLNRCYADGISDQELEETLSIGLIVGGSITIPHIRRAWDIWEELKND